jgi:hypothetical protein
MVDDRGQPADSTAPMERPDLGGPDQAAGQGRGATGPQRAVPGPAETAPLPRTGPAETAPIPRVADGPDATRTMPAVPDDGGRWAARATVPPPGAAPVRDYEYVDEPAPEGDGERSWLTPLVVGFVGLVLLGGLLTGLWLIAKSDDGGSPAPSASPPPAASTAAPTTRPPTTAPPTTAPPSTAAVTVSVPTLVGLSEDDARQRLIDAGLLVEVTRRVDGSVAPGTVVAATPGPGTEVAPNSVVRIVVATAPRPSTPRTSDDEDDD